MFVIYYNLNIAQICFIMKILRNATSWITIDDWYVSFVQRASTYVFPISKSFCKSWISPEYSNCDNSHFSPSNFVLQPLRATRWCKNIFPIFSKKIPPQSEVWKMMDGQVMFWMTFCSSGLLGNKQPSTKVTSERRIMKVCFGGYHSNYWWNDFIFLKLQSVYIT